MEFGKPFEDVLRELADREQAYGRAEELHRSSSNPILRAITGANLRLRLAQLRDIQDNAGVNCQLKQLEAGEVPMYED
jgi:hypothetical protein